VDTRAGSKRRKLLSDKDSASDLCYFNNEEKLSCDKIKRNYILNYFKNYLKVGIENFENVQFNNYYNYFLTKNDTEILMSCINNSNLK